TAAPSSSPQSSPGYAVRRHALVEQAAQQPAELLALGRLEPAEELLRGPLPGGPRRLLHLPACLGGDDTHRAPVVGVRGALHQAARLEGVDDLRGRARGDAQPGGDLAE